MGEVCVCKTCPFLFKQSCNHCNLWMRHKSPVVLNAFLLRVQAQIRALGFVWQGRDVGKKTINDPTRRGRSRHHLRTWNISSHFSQRPPFDEQMRRSSSRVPFITFILFCMAIVSVPVCFISFGPKCKKKKKYIEKSRPNAKSAMACEWGRNCPCMKFCSNRKVVLLPSAPLPFSLIHVQL